MGGTFPAEIAWRPQAGPQHALVQCPVFEILYGGARGGGKTDGMLGKFAVKQKMYGKNTVGIFLRRTREDLVEAKERSKEIYGPMGARLEGDKQWRFPSGARLKFEYLDRDKDANNYQGHNYTDVFFEELTHWPNPEPVNKLKATLRSAHGVPCQFHATANPGGPGHLWVKSRYIDPNPTGWETIYEEFENPFTGEKQRLGRVFIPSKLSDNAMLMDGDPLYVAKLHQSGSRELVRAWLEGDWDIVIGAYFDRWRKSGHAIRPFKIPGSWTRFRSFDWGSARPFSVGWWAISDGQYLPKNSIVRYREWYGAARKPDGSTDPNVGLKLSAEAVAQGIARREAGEVIKYGVADPSIFSEDGGPSIAERMKRAGIRWRPGDNKRVPGWDQIRDRLEGEDGKPMIYIFDTCRDFIRTFPALQHDENKPEDVDTNGEDHAADETRYACMSRPYSRPKPTIEDARWLAAPDGKIKPATFNDILKMSKADRSREQRI